MLLQAGPEEEEASLRERRKSCSGSRHSMCKGPEAAEAGKVDPERPRIIRGRAL